MRSWIITALVLLLVSVLNLQSAVTTVRPFNTLTDMANSNPSDINSNVVVISPYSFWTFYRGDTSTPNIVDTIASTWVGAGAQVGNWKLQGDLIGGSSVTNLVFGNTNVLLIIVDTIAAMKALNPCGGLGGVKVRGNATPDDGGGGDFVWLANDPTPEDGLVYFTPNNAGNCPGRWKRTFPTGYFTGINILCAGPTATNSTYNAVRDFAASVGGAPVVWPRFTNQIDNTAGSLELVNNQSMSGEDGNLILGNGTNAVFHGSGLHDITIKGLGISGGTTGIWLENCTNVDISYCAFSDMTNGVKYTGRNIRLHHNTYTNVVHRENDSETGDYLPVSVLRYGADPTGVTDSTAAFQAALGVLPFEQGGEIIIPPGKYAINVVVTNRNVTLQGFSGAGDSFITSVLVPWNTNNPVLYVGNDGANVSITNYAQGVKIRSLYLNGLGPNGMGKTGLHVDGGSYKNEFSDITTFNFAEYGLKITPGVNKETLYNRFWNCRFENCDVGIASVGILGKLLPSVSDLHFFGCNFTGCTITTNKPAILIDSASPSFHGCWIQGGSYSGVKLLKSFSPLPRMLCEGVTIECTGTPTPIVAVDDQFETNHLYGSAVIGTFSVNSGNYWMSMDGVPVAFLPGGTLADRTMMIQPALWNSFYFQQSGNGWTNLQTDIHMERVGNALNLASSNTSFGVDRGNTIYFDPGSSPLLGMEIRGNDKIAYFSSQQHSDQLISFFTAPSSVSIGAGYTNNTRTNGFFYIPAVNGTPSGTPYNLGSVPYVVTTYDIVGNKAWYYSFQDNAWHSPVGTPPGSDTQIPFNDGGVLGASTNLVFTKSNSKLIIGNKLNTASTLSMFVSSGGISTFNTGGGDMNIITGGGTLVLSGTTMQFAESAHTIGSGTTPLGTLFTLKVMWDNANNVFDAYGTGTPEGNLAAGIGSTFRSHDGSGGFFFFVKQTGVNTTTGWVGK